MSLWNTAWKGIDKCSVLPQFPSTRVGLFSPLSLGKAYKTDCFLWYSSTLQGLLHTCRAIRVSSSRTERGCGSPWGFVGRSFNWERRQGLLMLMWRSSGYLCLTPSSLLSRTSPPLSSVDISLSFKKVGTHTESNLRQRHPLALLLGLL